MSKYRTPEELKDAYHNWLVTKFPKKILDVRNDLKYSPFELDLAIMAHETFSETTTTYLNLSTINIKGKSLCTLLKCLKSLRELRML
jgi:hypothetical protein